MAVTMNSFWDSIGTVIPGGDAEYVVAEQPIAEYDNWFNYNVVADIQAVIDDVINKFNANTILKADTDNTPAALVVAEQTIVGRKTGNSIAALIDSEVLAIIGVEPGATADQTNTEIRDAVEAATDSNTFTDADHTKLNGVEALATTDQTNSEIRTAVEAATDSNVFTDADHTKLNGIEAAADVTDATNVAAATAVMDADFSASEGMMRKTGSGTYTVIKSNLSAAVAPTVNEDSGDGYGVGSRWLDTTADNEYVCMDATVGAAVWKETTFTHIGNVTANVQVYNGTTPTTATDLDLSAWVGAQRCLVAIHANCNQSAGGLSVRTNGVVQNAANDGVQYVTPTLSKDPVVIVMTDSAGVIEWWTGNAEHIYLTLQWSIVM